MPTLNELDEWNARVMRGLQLRPEQREDAGRQFEAAILKCYTDHFVPAEQPGSVILFNGVPVEWIHAGPELVPYWTVYNCIINNFMAGLEVQEQPERDILQDRAEIALYYQYNFYLDKDLSNQSFIYCGRPAHSFRTPEKGIDLRKIFAGASWMFDHSIARRNHC